MKIKERQNHCNIEGCENPHRSMGYCAKHYGASRNFPRSTEPKRCAKCFILKPADDFYSNRRCRDGLASYCVDCEKRIRQERNQKKRFRHLGIAVY